MGVGYDLHLLQEIACNAIAVNGAAGGAGAFENTGDYVPTLQTIVCQLSAANGALGATAVGAGDFNNIGGLFVMIACQAQAMAAVTGAGNVQPFDPYSALSVWNAIDCALSQVATNTGEGYAGWFNNSVENLMYGAVCLLAQIATNGFGPTDSFFILLNDGSGKVLANDGSFALQNSSP